MRPIDVDSTGPRPREPGPRPREPGSRPRRLESSDVGRRAGGGAGIRMPSPTASTWDPGVTSGLHRSAGPAACAGSPHGPRRSRLRREFL